MSKRAFQRVDHVLFRLLWKWARKQHPNKCHRWIVPRYWTRVGGDSWVFFGEVTNFDGSIRQVTLYTTTSRRIVRHVLIRGAVNPYDPDWWPYLANRANHYQRKNGMTTADDAAELPLPMT